MPARVVGGREAPRPSHVQAQSSCIGTEGVLWTKSADIHLCAGEGFMKPNDFKVDSKTDCKRLI